VVSGSPAPNSGAASIGGLAGQLGGKLMSQVPIAGSGNVGQEIIIRPMSEALRFDLDEHLRYRHLFWALVRRNVQTQFADLRLGFIWVFMRPLLYVAVFVLFRRLSNANVHVSIPYPLYVYSGLILWYYLIESIMQTVASVRADASIMTKVYYPRLITPMVPSVANLATLGCSLDGGSCFCQLSSCNAFCWRSASAHFSLRSR
jgi:hypothetical protein